MATRAEVRRIALSLRSLDDVTNLIQVRMEQAAFARPTGMFTMTARLRNTSRAPIAGPIRSQGPIPTVVARPRLLYPGETISIGLRQTDGYSLDALGTTTHEIGGSVLTDYALWVRHQQESQLIAAFPRNSPEHPRQIIWIGDLDRDMRPDALFDSPISDVGANYQLFLSSAAPQSQFLARVAAFSTPGC